MSAFSFLKEGLKNIRTTGTITRSGTLLCLAAIDRIDWSEARTIVELGAGDGVITRHILRHLHPEGKVIAFEVSDDLCDDLRAIGDDRLVVANDSAEHLRHYLDEAGADQADHIISAIPYAALPRGLGREILAAAKKNLRKGGRYNQVHYSLKTRAWYEESFASVEARRILLNLPPAWVLYCKND